MQTVLITGGTGLIGSALSIFLREKGYEIIILTRGKTTPPDRGGVRYAGWNPAKNEVEAEAIRRADHIIHLAGANVGRGRWTPAKKKEIRESRIQSTRLLFDSLSHIPNKVKTFISASGTGYYGHCPGKLLTEEDKAAHDFLGEVCTSWEAEAQKIGSLNKRVVILRTGIVLSRAEGMLPALVRPLRLGAAAIPGNGEQWLSWIHLHDLARLYTLALTDEKINGIYNAVTPFPVTLQQLMNNLARVIKGRFYIPVYIPTFALKLFMGEKGMEILKSGKASAEKLMQAGFEFSYPTIGSALEELYGKETK